MLPKQQTNRKSGRADPHAVICSVFFLAIGLNSGHAMAQPPATNSERPFEVIVPAPGGIVQWEDVANSVAESMTLDADSVKQMLPNGSLNLRSDAVMLMLLGVDLAFGDSLSIDIARDPKNQPALRLRCRRDAFAKALPAEKRTEPKLFLDKDWNEKSGQRPLVVCIHGLKGKWSAFDDFRNDLRSQGFGTAAIGYDYDQPIESSARQIAKLIGMQLNQPSTRARSAEDRENHPVRIALVGHSMGGLVAREWAENSDIDSSCLSHLFTVATPHGGSNWASLPPMLNFVTEGAMKPEDLIDILLHQPGSQGLRDLQPGSEYLKRMAARNRSTKIAYTTIIGTHCPANPSDVDALRDSLIQLDQDGSLVRLIRPRIKPLLESFDELVEGKGDGVVTVENAKLTGVDDVVLVGLSHGDMFRPIDQGNHPVWQAISERLTKGLAPISIKK